MACNIWLDSSACPNILEHEFRLLLILSQEADECPEREVRLQSRSSEDYIGIGRPHERLGISVALVEIVEHGLLQDSDSSVTAAADTALGHFCEKALPEVEPTSAGGREMNVIARVATQPSANFGNLVRTVVIHHQMHVPAGGKILLDLVERPQELWMPVPG